MADKKKLIQLVQNATNDRRRRLKDFLAKESKLLTRPIEKRQQEISNRVLAAACRIKGMTRGRIKSTIIAFYDSKAEQERDYYAPLSFDMRSDKTLASLIDVRDARLDAIQEQIDAVDREGRELLARIATTNGPLPDDLQSQILAWTTK